MRKTVRLIGGVRAGDEWRLKGADHWAMNNFHSIVTGPSAWFQIHDEEQIALGRNGMTHVDWLKKPHEFPVYMIRRHEEYPASVEYPYEKVCKLWPFPGEPVFSNTFCYMVALAMLHGYKRIDLYKVNLNTSVEAWLEAPGLCLWLGIAAARGIRITGDCRMLEPFSYGREERTPPHWLSDEVAGLVMITEYPYIKTKMALWMAGHA